MNKPYRGIYDFGHRIVVEIAVADVESDNDMMLNKIDALSRNEEKLRGVAPVRY